MLLIHLLLTLLATLAAAKRPSNAILLSTVKTLTLRADQLTSARRVKAIPQLKCVGGRGKGLYEVDVMRCKNSGSEYDTEDISWTCQAQLPPEFKLGSTEVICEGYNDSDDPYVLKGSCGVEYRLALTDLGEAKYGKGGWGSQARSTFAGDDDGQSTLFKIVFWLIFLGIVLLLVYKFGQGLNVNVNANRRPRRLYNDGYGGGPGDDDDPPPPYSRRPPAPKPYSQPSQRSRSQQSWRPGFWSGAAAGAAAGYAMGGRNSNRNAHAQAQAGPSNWWNTGVRNNAPTTSNTGGWGSSQASSSTPSSTRYESSGFGGTRRR